MREQEKTCSWDVKLSDKNLTDYCINVHAIRHCYLPYLKEKCGRKAIDAYVALFAFNANLRAYGDTIFDNLKSEPAECKELMTGGIGPVPKTTLKPTDEVATSTVIEFPTTTNNDTALNETEDTEDSDPFDTTPNSGPVKHAFHISGIFLGCILALFWTG
ncbi:hypothetical protein Ddc_16410 [Ditylenchus destructor]|nr:hypothetical protein Ddc_16410 [Ditylenchus destructor]